MQPAAPLTERNPAILEMVRKEFGNSIRETYESNGMLVLLLDPTVNVEVCRMLKESPDCSYNMMLDLCAVDYPSRKERFEIVVHLHSMKYQHRIRLRFPMLGNEPEIRTLSVLWDGANWAEREAFDLFGVKFAGHPDLRRIVNPHDFEGHPLRKDFPTKGLKRGRFPLGDVINNKRVEFPEFYQEDE